MTTIKSRQEWRIRVEPRMAAPRERTGVRFVSHERDRSSHADDYSTLYRRLREGNPPPGRDREQRFGLRTLTRPGVETDPRYAAIYDPSPRIGLGPGPATECRRVSDLPLRRPPKQSWSHQRLRSYEGWVDGDRPRERAFTGVHIILSDGSNERCVKQRQLRSSTPASSTPRRDSGSSRDSRAAGLARVLRDSPARPAERRTPCCRGLALRPRADGVRQRSSRSFGSSRPTKPAPDPARPGIGLRPQPKPPQPGQRAVGSPLVLAARRLTSSGDAVADIPASWTILSDGHVGRSAGPRARHATWPCTTVRGVPQHAAPRPRARLPTIVRVRRPRTRADHRCAASRQRDSGHGRPEDRTRHEVSAMSSPERSHGVDRRIRYRRTRAAQGSGLPTALWPGCGGFGLRPKTYSGPRRSGPAWWAANELE